MTSLFHSARCWHRRHKSAMIERMPAGSGRIFRGEEKVLKARFILAFLVVSASIALFAFAGPGLADPSDLFVPQVPPHRHFIETPTGKLVPVGPQVCEKPELMPAFEQFHFNVHHSRFPGSGTIHTLGPQDGAPGLHPSKDAGATLTARGCSFPARP